MSLISADNIRYKDIDKPSSKAVSTGFSSAEKLILLIIMLSVVYNGILAALLAHGLPIGPSVPAGVEITIIICGVLIIIGHGIEKSSLIPICLLLFVITISLLISIKNDQIYFVPARNFSIIAIFTILGGLCSAETLRKSFRYSCIAVLITLIFEVTWLNSYVKFFEPARYLSSTRGMSESEYSGGLSAGTILFEGRFSLGIYSGPRTSSIFLEQVSINCFAIVAALYLLTFGPKLKKFDIALHALTILFILATNNARMALIASAIFMFGYSIFPRLPKYLNTVFMPLILCSLFVTFSFISTASGDDIVGRMSTTYNLLTSMSVENLLIGSISGTSRSFDSGYAFVIFSTTVFGMILYWLYVSFIINQVNASSARCAWGLSIYIGIWLLVGGTGTFSMKTAPLLWLMVGFVRRQAQEITENAKTEKAKPVLLTPRIVRV